MRISAAVALSALGMAFHVIREFGVAGVLAPETGTVAFAAIQATLLAVWWLQPTARTWTATALAATGWVQLVGGAIVSLLPLAILPFEPEQSIGHYISHAVYGVAQLPLILGPLRRRDPEWSRTARARVSS